MLTSAKLTTVLFLLILAVGGHVSGAQWSDDVQVGTHTDILNVELEYDLWTGTMLAVICWEGDGCTSYFSADLGETWTETFSQGPGATVNDISCLSHKGYFYVALATPAVLVLYRFNPNTGAQVNFGEDPFLVIATNLWEEVKLTTPHHDSDLLCFIGHDDTGRIRAYSLNLTGGSSAHLTLDVGADKGLDAASCLSSDWEDYTWISYITDEGFLRVQRYRWSDGDLSQYYELNLLSTSPNETAIAVDAIPAGSETVYVATEYSTYPSNLAIASSPGWVALAVEQPDSILSCPALYCRQGEDLALAYSYSVSPGPSAPIYGRFRLLSLEDELWQIAYMPRENSVNNYPSSTVKPDIEFIASSTVYGLLYATKTSPTQAYFTMRTPGCCGTYTGGITGNANCSDDGKLTLSDISRMIDFLYISKADLCCYAAGNTNGSWDDGDCKITLSDISKLIDALYISKQPTEDCMPECER